MFEVSSLTGIRSLFVTAHISFLAPCACLTFSIQSFKFEVLVTMKRDTIAMLGVPTHFNNTFISMYTISYNSQCSSSFSPRFLL